ncbi:MAG: hypothetical protein COV74_10660 [Candidatus Omnitrophica bacterium CG11_big_fil_rev_8_21_14_0_20_45_26]|uniref:Uncharacterized protein n=1 Tax=Candidatus Abzuiibacterium crystallinum TaxID=1974748 RepID=A0A2H0LKV6_9BACT|nr:MAG: hypothetical protein COV74_10660 [Candidatus Omnitrophica bacterium CG11_big_fil_rev_8_21_14_0_20_45_26]
MCWADTEPTEEPAKPPISVLSFQAKVGGSEFGVIIQEDKAGIIFRDFMKPLDEADQTSLRYDNKALLNQKEYNELWNLILLKVKLWGFVPPKSEAISDDKPYWHFIFRRNLNSLDFVINDSLSRYPEMQKIVQILTAFSAVKFRGAPADSQTASGRIS